MSQKPRIFLPTDAWVRWAIVPVLVFVALIIDRNYLADFWHHLARGRAMAQEGRMVDRDLFTFTVFGQPLQDVNWLTQLLYYYLFEAGGLALVQFVNALTLAVALGLLVVLCRRLGGSLGIAATVGIATFFGLWHVLTVRPQTFSLLLFVLLYDLLERAQRRRWLLVLAPPLLALWANLHGAFPAGVILIGGFLAAAGWEAWRGGRLWRDPYCQALLSCLLVSCLATLVNPYGWRIYQYVGLTSNRAAQRRIDEWVPPSWDQWIGIAFFVSLVLVGILGIVCWLRRGWRPTPRDVVLLLGFLPLACGSIRMVAWWLLILAPLLAILLARLRPTTATEPSPPSIGAGIVLVLMAVFVLFSLPGLQAVNPLLAARQGPRLEDDLDTIHGYLRERFTDGRIFTRFEWGEYLSWAYSPAFKVFMDGRIEIIPDDVWEAYAKVTRGDPGWEKVLDDYRVDVLLLDADYHACTGLLPRVTSSPRWRQTFAVGKALVYER